MKSQDILPVVASIAIIILVAIIEKQSKLIAALTAVMPIGATLALWIVSSSAGSDQPTMERFSKGLLLGILPSVLFVLVAWIAFRAGLKLTRVLLVGYAVWGVGTGAILLLRSRFGL